MKKAFLLLLVLLLLGGVTFYKASQLKPLFISSVATWSNDRIPSVDSASLRETESGKVVGFADSYNTYGWLNIPYAAPPIGELRWRAPRAAIAWNDVHEATAYGSSCLQFWGVLAAEDGEQGDIVGDEDCLSLNIWAPRDANVEARKPVMVWIHGGGNNSGTAKLYQAHHLAGSQDVVVVLINYRLALMGWLSHSAIRATSKTPEDASGNFGTLDMIAALNWVQRNIHEFGGDADNVTIFGESAGGKNVLSLMASPLAKGLFHRAISQSGSADTTVRVLAEDIPNLEEGAPVSGLVNSSAGLLTSLGYNSINSEATMDFLRSIDAKQLMRQAAGNLDSVDEMHSARVIRDGTVIPNESILSILNDPAKYNSVPLMLGANRDEQKIFQVFNPEYVNQHFGFLPRAKDRVNYQRISDYISDNWKALAVDEPAKRILQSGSSNKVFAYRFDMDELPSSWLADIKFLIGAGHGFELSYVFGDFVGGIPIQRLLNNDSAESRRALALTIMDYWGNFAHTGNPGEGRSGTQKSWTPWVASGKNIMALNGLAGGGSKMIEARISPADIKNRIASDAAMKTTKDRCEAYALLMLHGYMASDFFDPQEYSALGCDAYPALMFRQG